MDLDLLVATVDSKLTALQTDLPDTPSAIFQALNELSALDENLAKFETDIPHKLAEFESQARTLNRSFTFTVLPQLSQFIDDFEAANTVTFTRYLDAYEQAKHQLETQQAALEAELRRAALKELQSVQAGFKDHLLAYLATSGNVLGYWAGGGGQSLMSSRAILEAIQNQLKERGKTVKDLLSSPEVATLLDEGLKAYVLMKRMVELRDNIPDASEYVVKDDAWDPFLEDVEINSSPTGTGMANERHRQARHLVECLLREAIRVRLTDPQVSPITLEKAIQVAEAMGLSAVFWQCVRESAHDIVHDRCQKARQLTSERKLGPARWTQAQRQLGESIADSIQQFSVVTINDKFGSNVHKLAFLRCLVRWHIPSFVQVCQGFRISHLARNATENLSNEATLVEVTQTLGEAAGLCNLCVMIENYIRLTSTDIVRRLPADWVRRLEEVEHTWSIEHSGKSINPDNGLYVGMLTWDVTREELVNDFVALEIEYLREAIRRALVADEVSLECPSNVSWSELTFVPLVPPARGSRNTLEYDRWQHLGNELISATTTGSTLPDDILFILDGCFTRILSSSERFGVCAVLNFASHLLTEMLVPALAQRAAQAVGYYGQVLKAHIPPMDEEHEGSIPFLTLRHLVPFLPPSVQAEGKLGSAHVLPHALRNYTTCITNLPHLIDHLAESVKDLPGYDEEVSRRLFKPSIHTLLDQIREFRLGQESSVKLTAQVIYREALNPVFETLHSVNWDVPLNAPPLIYCEKVSERLALLNAEWLQIFSEEVYQYLLIDLCDLVAEAFLTVIDGMCSRIKVGNVAGVLTYSEGIATGSPADETKSDGLSKPFHLFSPEQSELASPAKSAISCFGALELDRAARGCVGWFVERSESNLRSRYTRLFDICDIMAAQSVSELSDLFEVSTTKVWQVSATQITQLVALRKDLEEREQLPGFLLSLKQGVIFAFPSA